MLLGQVFERFVTESPVSVMVRGLLEKALCPQIIDELFERSAKTQYTRELLFSTVVNLMSLVVCGVHPSVHAAHQASVEKIGVSVTSVYNKINGIEPSTGGELVREVAGQMEATIRHLNATMPDLLPGYRVKIIDGNAIAATEHRLKPLREISSAPLPGQSLVVLDPSLMLAVDVFPCEDGHAQERSLFDEVLPTVEEDDVWIADRNFCTLKFLFGVAAGLGYFIIRQHQSLPWQATDDFRLVGQSDSGTVFEQNIILSADDGQLLKARRIKVCLKQPNRDGDREIFILTNLPFEVANALVVAQMYRKRWKLEILFQVLTENLCCEINTLGYPKAALFTFCIALVAYNILSTVQAALRSFHGTEKIEAEISSYYLADEIKGTYRGMMIAIPPNEWCVFQNMTFSELSQTLKHLAGLVKLRTFRRHLRDPKKAQPKRTYLKNKPHVSTVKILNQKKLQNHTP
ncbi:MAG: transposase [Nostoc sp. DedQUE08]|uniref:transposase n=1 Tax=Nostoc sp. DedQUE08 TaxID=3075393 RepID=UPI002AD33609|nr:transposase [Nostoc sp. DedQUE08]MDZ8066259.1 transposase [Nostoc sp. DedQUE08]